jgi:hypothetical protein
MRLNIGELYRWRLKLEHYHVYKSEYLALSLYSAYNKTIVKEVEMSLTELLPNLQKLERADKLRAVQFLVTELAKEEGIAPLDLGTVYPVWSPHNAHEAADTLLHMLSEEKNTDYGNGSTVQI